MLASFLGPLRAVERFVASVLLAVTVVLVIVASVSRYFGVPVIWAIEVVQAMFVWLCVLAADLTLQRSGHFSVDLFANLLPPGARRALDVLNLLLGAMLLGALGWYGYQFAVFTGMRPLPITGVTSAAATAALPFGFVLMLVTLIEQLVGCLRGRGRMVEPSASREVM